jgi:hypothetical protein
MWWWRRRKGVVVVVHSVHHHVVVVMMINAHVVVVRVTTVVLGTKVVPQEPFGRGSLVGVSLHHVVQHGLDHHIRRRRRGVSTVMIGNGWNRRRRK